MLNGCQVSPKNLSHRFKFPASALLNFFFKNTSLKIRYALYYYESARVFGYPLNFY